MKAKDYTSLPGIWVRAGDWKQWQGYIVTADHTNDGRKFGFVETMMFVKAYWQRSSNKFGAAMNIAARALTFRLKPSQAPESTMTEKCRPESDLQFVFDEQTLTW
ncbi:MULTISPECIES: hypothetical protein [Muribaculaceae]|uniref:hypothetical protein n=1 Tax=Muribaculaceae TaxID=2005473 RepID=UPI002649EDEE|nr:MULTISPECIES: hypothetical protein [Muribaculaceae]